MTSIFFFHCLHVQSLSFLGFSLFPPFSSSVCWYRTSLDPDVQTEASAALPEFKLEPRLEPKSELKIKVELENIWNYEQKFRTPWLLRTSALALAAAAAAPPASVPHHRIVDSPTQRTVGGSALIRSHRNRRHSSAHTGTSNHQSADKTWAIFECVPPFLLEESRAQGPGWEHGSGWEHGCCSGDVFLLWCYCEQLQH